MEEFPSNSRKATEKETSGKEDIQQIVTGTVKRTKKPLGRRVRDTFIGGDDATSVWGYILHDVLVPAFKDTITDAITQGVERMVFGEVRGRAAGNRSLISRNASPSYTNYSRPGGAPRREEQRRDVPGRGVPRVNQDFERVLLDTRAEATDVLDKMYEILSKYQVVTVADLYGMLGLTTRFTDEQWGWEDLRGSQIVHMKGGYLLDLSDPVAIK